LKGGLAQLLLKTRLYNENRKVTKQSGAEPEPFEQRVRGEGEWRLSRAAIVTNGAETNVGKDWAQITTVSSEITTIGLLDDKWPSQSPLCL
jgi:hypothetical protein